MANITALATKAARQAGIPVGLYVALITKGERSYSGWQRSPAGAEGPAQLMPGTAAGLSKKYGINTSGYYGNLLGGAYYLREQLQRFGSPRLAVAAYNAGPGAVAKYGGVPPFRETQTYVHNILGAEGLPSPSVVQVGRAPSPAMPSAGLVPPPPPAPRFTIDRPSIDPSTFLMSNLGKIGAGVSPTQTLESTSSQLLEQMLKPAKLNVSFPSLPRTAVAEHPLAPTVQVKGPVTARAQKAVQFISQYLGTPYSWGGGGPKGPSKGIAQGAGTVGFDCSSLVQYAWARAGIGVPRTTYEQWQTGRAVPKGQLKPGDAVFFRPGPRGPEHEGMYIGGGKFIEAPGTGKTIRISNLSERSDFMGARRYS